MRLEDDPPGGAWVAQWVERPPSAPAVVSWFVSSSPASGSVPIAASLEPGSVSPRSLPLPHSRAVSLKNQTL